MANDDSLDKEFPEGIPPWMKGKSPEEVRKLMALRRKAFPATAPKPAVKEGKTYTQFISEAKSNAGDDPLEDRLIGAHWAEAKRKKAKIYNDGWGSSRVHRHSKTSKGLLYSEIDPHTKKVTHSWD